MKLLLHACCAPCSIKSVELLNAEGIQVLLFWYNPNIHPFTEYNARLDSLRLFAKENRIGLVEECNTERHGGTQRTQRYKSGEEESSVSSVPLCNLRDRCAVCYRIRLKRAAEVAAENGCDAFSTTLFISPYQNHELIRQIGEEEAGLAASGATRRLEFFYRDFRPVFRESQSAARLAGYYMQKYCGCIYSEQERRRR